MDAGAVTPRVIQRIDDTAHRARGGAHERAGAREEEDGLLIDAIGEYVIVEVLCHDDDGETEADRLSDALGGAWVPLYSLPHWVVTERDSDQEPDEQTIERWVAIVGDRDDVMWSVTFT